jgi:murein DD-endopeptidase MepM/ murein hydrolase activator NlpD
MVLEADTLIHKKRQKPKKRMNPGNRNPGKDVLLIKQRVGKKRPAFPEKSGRAAGFDRWNRGTERRTLLAAPFHAAGKGFARLLKPLRGAFRSGRVLPFRGLSAGSFQSVFLLTIGIVAALMLLAYGTQRQWGAESTDEQIALPDDSSARVHLLHYIAPESEAKGSGEVGIPDGRIIDQVKTFSYTIERGDTLSEIAAKHDLDVGTLISFNDIDDVRRVMAGTELTIPDVDGIPYTVKKGDTLERIAGRYDVPLENILDANDLQSATIQPGQTLFIPGGEISEYDYKKAMGTLFIYPSLGRLTSGYGYRNDPFTGLRRMHYGIDLADSVGTIVKSTMAGRVATIGNQPRGYGKYVVIQHRHGFQSLYGHLSTIEVRRGEYIRQGQKVGEMGNSGRSTGPHLHFSLYKNNVPVNPLSGYLYQ